MRFAMALLEERGFSADDLAAHHPKGNLGRQLLRVHHVMHTDAGIPVVNTSCFRYTPTCSPR